MRRLRITVKVTFIGKVKNENQIIFQEKIVLLRKNKMMTSMTKIPENTVLQHSIS